MKRKVYVMDCGDFVKIGVSGNVEQRATQIPYKVNRIYSTDEMEDAFKRNDALSASLWAFDIALIRELRTEYFDRIAQAHLS